MSYQYHHHTFTSPFHHYQLQNLIGSPFMWSCSQTNKQSDGQTGNYITSLVKVICDQNLIDQLTMISSHSFPLISTKQCQSCVCIYLNQHSTPTISMVIVTSDNTVNLAEILHWCSCNDTQHCHSTDSHLTHYTIQTTQLVAKKCCR